jgi:hypothetical protein
MTDSPGNEEARKIAEQARDFEARRWLAAGEKFAALSHAERMYAMEALKHYGSSTIRTLFLLNGASIIASLSLIGSLFTKGETSLTLVAVSLTHALKPALICFVIGLILATVVSGLAYLNFSAVAQSYWTPEHLFQFLHAKQPDPAPDSPRLIKGTARLAVALSVTSLAAFCVGAWVVADAFSTLGAR